MTHSPPKLCETRPIIDAKASENFTSRAVMECRMVANGDCDVFDAFSTTTSFLDEIRLKTGFLLNENSTSGGGLGGNFRVIMLHWDYRVPEWKMVTHFRVVNYSSIDTYDIIWSYPGHIFSDLTPLFGPLKVAIWKGIPLISGKSRLLKYYSIWPESYVFLSSP